MKALLQLNKYLWKYKLRLCSGLLFVTIGTFFAVYPVKYVQKAVDYVEQASREGKVYTSETANQLLIYGGLIILMALLNGLFMFLKRQTIIVMSRFIEYDLKNDIYQHYQLLDTGFYKRNNTGDLMNRISEDVGRVRMYVGPSIMYIIDTFSIFILVVIAMLQVNTKLTLYALLPLPILSFAIYKVSATINRKSTLLQQQLSHLSTLAQEGFSGIRILKAFNREAHFNNQFYTETLEYQKRNMALARIEGLFQPFMIMLIGLSTIITIYVGGLQVIEGKISMGNIAEFVIYVSKLTWPVASLGWVTSLIQRASASQARINEFLNTQPSIQNNPQTTHQPRGAIRFENVSFTYPHTGIKAIKQISFTVPEGQSLAIIGKTASGKSTIAQLLCRMYDPESGGIYIGDTLLQHYDLHQLRKSIGYVPQEVFLFSDTIENNIRFGLPDAHESQILQAAQWAHIDQNIQEFTLKYQTRVGERGITLSGGQKQRISIARALIKEPQLLILDDCLSAVDTQTEEIILRNLKNLMLGKTSIIISHRVSSVKMADTILVIEDGEIKESGNHQKLIQENGLYAQMHQQQLLEESKETF